MFKQYKKTLIAASLFILLPAVVGLVLWNRLPDRIPTHFGTDNQVNGWSSKPMAVLGMPFLMLAIEFFCAFFANADPKRKNINRKMMQMILWIIPVISIVACLSCYAVALGISVDIGMLINVMLGIMFIIMGNYMPKLKQNYSAGIKLPWTLNSEENWNRTHRMGSWMFIIGGVAFIINGFLQSEWILIAFLVAVGVIPTGYSYYLYKKGI